MTHRELFHLAGRVRMGDRAAIRLAREILRRGDSLPPGHPERELARALARCLASRTSTRTAWLPQPGRGHRHPLALRLADIFRRGRGKVRLHVSASMLARLRSKRRSVGMVGWGLLPP